MMAKAIRSISEYVKRRVVAAVARDIQADLDAALGADEEGLVLEIDYEEFTEPEPVAIADHRPAQRAAPANGKPRAKKKPARV